MKYKDLYKIREDISKLVTENHMSSWEEQKAKEISKKEGTSLVEGYYTVLRCRNLWGSLV